MKYTLALLRTLFSLLVFNIMIVFNMDTKERYNNLMETLYKYWLDMYPYSPYGTIRRLVYYWVLHNWFIAKNRAGFVDGNGNKSFVFWLNKWYDECKANNIVRL